MAFELTRMRDMRLLQLQPIGTLEYPWWRNPAAFRPHSPTTHNLRAADHEALALASSGATHHPTIPKRYQVELVPTPKRDRSKSS